MCFICTALHQYYDNTSPSRQFDKTLNVEEFEDTKEVIRIRISKKNRQHNDELISYNIQYDLLSGTRVFIFYGPIIWWNHQIQEITVTHADIREDNDYRKYDAKVRVKHWITTHWPPPFFDIRILITSLVSSNSSSKHLIIIRLLKFENMYWKMSSKVTQTDT
jgi:hypothetical protein